LDDHQLVCNLINRIVLALMGYQGQYVKYAKPKWLEEDLPLHRVVWDF
jgi:hypothetical protein